MSKQSKQLSYRELSENFIRTKSEKDYNALYARVKPGLKNYIAKIWSFIVINLISLHAKVSLN